MATSHAVRRPVRAIILAAVAALGFGLLPGTGYADPETDAGAETSTVPQPTTVAEAQDLIADMNHQLEIVTEQYNDAVILLDQREQEMADAEARVAAAHADMATLDGEIRAISRGAYTGDGVPSFTALMTSGSPQEFLDRVNTLEQISGYNNDRAVAYARAEQQAAQAAAEAEQARAAAEATTADIEAKKTTIETDLPVIEALLATLTEAERQAALNRPHAGSGQGAGAPSSQEEEAMQRGSGGGGGGGTVAAPTQAAQIAVDTAYAQLGDPYVWGGSGPNSFDCSGLTMYSYAAAGISLPHSSNMQSTMGVYVSRSNLQPGDLVFYYSPVSHVAIYVGNGQVIHAPNSGSVVQLADVDMWGAYNHAQRVALP